MAQQVDILLVEDNPADVVLIKEALKDNHIHNQVRELSDGQAALDSLNDITQVLPGLIILDLELPKVNGLDVLKYIKNDSRLKQIPTVIMTMSQDAADIARSYDLQANCYITKPVNYEALVTIIKSIENFWLNIVQLPNQ